MDFRFEMNICTSSFLINIELTFFSFHETPRPNKVILEFFQNVHMVISRKYIKMVQTSIQKGLFLLGVTNGLITLIHKRGGCKQGKKEKRKKRK
jgi:sulfite exporter TauE/SafE